MEGSQIPEYEVQILKAGMHGEHSPPDVSILSDILQASHLARAAPAMPGRT